MIKKKTARTLLLGLTTIMLLSGCRLIGALWPSSSSSEDDPTSTTSSTSTTTSITTSDPTSSETPPPSSETPTSQEPGDGYTRPGYSSQNFRELAQAKGLEALESTGTQSVLVVPVDFTDYRAASQLGGAAASKNRIEKSFFGSTSETGWHSVKTYFHESSYGKLNVSGEVLPWLNLPISRDAFKTIKNSNPSYYDNTCYVLDKIKEQYPDKMKEYDKDGNGYVDALFIVYACPFDSSDPDMTFWAYVFWDMRYDPNVSNPEFNVYGWASYHFMDDAPYIPSTTTKAYEIDAHTYIHEFGHILGLDDYYNYDGFGTGYLNMSGGIDMQAFNIIDHNMYSKFGLQWAQPYLVNDTTTINLKPAHSSGEFIIIQDDYFGSAFDEYILIEYYQPKGLNYMDSTIGYSNGASGHSLNGVRIWHVDSRMFLFNASYNPISYDQVQYIKDFDGNSFTAIGPSNTPSRSIYNDVYYLHLLESTGINTFKDGGIASDVTLFKQGQTFTPSSTFFKYGNKFNSQKTIGYTISIGQMTNQEVVINITKTA